ncbi:MAG: Gfo/Idh/MocA family oxidoreductase [Bacteroidota bacterium]
MDQENSKLSRRSVLKGLAGIPIVGGVLAGALVESGSNQKNKERILKALNIQASPPPPVGSMEGDPIKIGIIGFGGRGEHLCRAAGHATGDWLENAQPGAIKAFKEQENLNTKITAVCDLFTVRAKKAITLAEGVKRFDSYQKLLEKGDVDAVIIATADHWHAPISIAALDAGKHVYVEKPMTHNLAETYALRDAVKRNNRTVFAVGHQHRQTQSFLTAQDIIKKKILGHISLIQVNTNRNSDNGAWQYGIHSEASPATIDWDQFLGDAPKIPFNKEHFFRWRKWWAYGSGLSGDLMTHDYDRINCILNMGVPQYVSASGGIYTHRDGRNVPDVYQVNMEYPELQTGRNDEKTMGMTLVYSATLGNQHNRSTLLMGTEASMELGNSLTVYVDPASQQFKEMMQDNVVEGGESIYSYDPAGNNTDGITSATSKYFADKGLLWTYRDGKRVDSTFLHIKEWLSCIRNGGNPSCGIKEGFEEAITAHMAGLAYKIGRRMEWDPLKEEIIALPGENLDEILLANTDRIYHGAMANDLANSMKV